MSTILLPPGTVSYQTMSAYCAVVLGVIKARQRTIKVTKDYYGICLELPYESVRVINPDARLALFNLCKQYASNHKLKVEHDPSLFDQKESTPLRPPPDMDFKMEIDPDGFHEALKKAMAQGPLSDFASGGYTYAGDTYFNGFDFDPFKKKRKRYTKL